MLINQSVEMRLSVSLKTYEKAHIEILQDNWIRLRQFTRVMDSDMSECMLELVLNVAMPKNSCSLRRAATSAETRNLLLR